MSHVALITYCSLPEYVYMCLIPPTTAVSFINTEIVFIHSLYPLQHLESTSRIKRYIVNTVILISQINNSMQGFGSKLFSNSMNACPRASLQRTALNCICKGKDFFFFSNLVFIGLILPYSWLAVFAHSRLLINDH